MSRSPSQRTIEERQRRNRERMEAARLAVMVLQPLVPHYANLRAAGDAEVKTGIHDLLRDFLDGVDQLLKLKIAAEMKSNSELANKMG